MKLTKKQKEILKLTKQCVADLNTEAKKHFQDCLFALGINDTEANINRSNTVFDYLHGQGSSLKDVEQIL